MKTALGALLILAGVPAPLFADTGMNEHAICVRETPCRMASGPELDELRGGFDVDTLTGRLRVGIGITRSVAVNNRLVATSELVIPDLGLAFAASRGRGQAPTPQVRVSILPAEANVRVTSDGNALIVQNGPGNFAPRPSAFNALALPIVAQSSLDGTTMTIQTNVTAIANSLSIMNTLRLGEAMSRATAASGR